MRKLEIPFRSSHGRTISGKSLRLQACVILALGVLLVGTPAHGRISIHASSLESISVAHLPSGFHDLDRLLRRMIELQGGSPDDRSLDDAPMAQAQVLYVQMGGDPIKLDFNKQPVADQWTEFEDLFVILGGDLDLDTFKPPVDNVALDLLWEYFLSQGGRPLGG